MRTRIRLTRNSLLVLALAGCKAEMPKLSELPPDSAAVTVAAADTRKDSVPAAATWKVTPHGIGPLRAGMSVAEVKTLVPRFDAPADIFTSECTYARSPSLPVGAVLMFTNGSLSRVDVLSGRVKSELGAGIGDAEEEVKLLHGGSVATSPHKYTQGHYMIVKPANPADSTFRIVFETDGDAVIRYRSGRLPEVEYVEGCG